MARGKNSRLRAARGRPAEPRRSNAPVTTDPKEWVYVAVPPLVEAVLFRAAHAQLEENRSRARQGRRRPGYLLQGLTRCARCGYAYYGKTIRQLGTGRQMGDFVYYRCGGSDGYRSGGEAICGNKQVQGKFLETAVSDEVCGLLTNPQKVQADYSDRNETDISLDNMENLKPQRLKLQYALERLIDGFTAGLIEKDQFASRIDRAKLRIASLDAEIKESLGDAHRRENLRFATDRLRELASVITPELTSANWHRRREIIRTLVQRIDIETGAIRIIFRVTQNSRGSATDSIAVTLTRP